MDKLMRTVVGLGVGLSAVGFIDKFCLINVAPGQRCVIFDRFRGVLDDVLGEGTWPIIPFIQEPTLMDIRDQPRVTNTRTGTKDLQMVNISLRILSRPVPEQLPWIFKNLNTDFNDRVLPSISTEVLKAVVANYNAEDLLRRREDVSLEIATKLAERANEFHLILDDVAITHLTFGTEYARAIEAKQVAQQEAERATFIVKKAEQERKAAIILAEGEATAADLISKAIQQSGAGLIEVRRIDTAKEAAAALAQSRNVTYLPTAGGQGSNANFLLALS